MMMIMIMLTVIDGWFVLQALEETRIPLWIITVS